MVSLPAVREGPQLAEASRRARGQRMTGIGRRCDLRRDGSLMAGSDVERSFCGDVPGHSTWKTGLPRFGRVHSPVAWADDSSELASRMVPMEIGEASRYRRDQNSLASKML